MFKAIHVDDIQIPPTRQRQEFNPQPLAELMDSIERNGLLQPIIIRDNIGPEGVKHVLVAGERRIRAIKDMWAIGMSLSMGDTKFQPGYVPCVDLAALSDIDAYEAELEENIRREDLTWQERAQSTAALYELRRLQSDKSGGTLPLPTINSVAKEIRPEMAPKQAHTETHEELIVARHLQDPEVAKASSRDNAMKVIRRKEDLQKSAALGRAVGLTFSSADHTLWKGDCLDKMRHIIPSESFDVILTDPPYGIDAQEFNDSDGKTPGGHFYDDSFKSWLTLMREFIPLADKVAKVEAHLYLFCDIDNFGELKSLLEEFSSFRVFRTPIIWHNPGGIRAPWPDKGPQRKYQICLYAVKGGRKTIKLAPDLISCSSDTNLNHPAQKPVAVYQDLLKRSCRPGDFAFDPFCGSGTIFPACHGLQIKATGIEMDEAAYGIAVKRLGDLK